MALYDPQQIQNIIRRNVGTAVAPTFEVATVGDDHVELRMAYVDGMTRLGDTLSGPVLMTAADAAMYAALIAFVPDGEYAVTSHFNIDFLRRPAATDLRIAARVLRSGRRSVNCAVELFSGDDDRLVAYVTGAYARMSSSLSGSGVRSEHGGTASRNSHDFEAHSGTT